jgi:hypothetical protein
MYWLEKAPLWVIGLAILAALVLAHELSAAAGRRWSSARGPDDSKGYLVSAALGLLALMLAFSYSAAQSRFDLRQSMVAQEAVTMGTAYLRTQLTSRPWRDELGARLLDYGEVRVSFFRAAEDPERLTANYKASQKAQQALWTLVDNEIRANPTSTVNITLIQGLNEMFDAADLRLAAQELRIPIAVLRMLGFFSLAVACVVGFAGAGGGSRRHLAVSAVVLVLNTLAYTMILDLDRPGSGTVLIDQRPMERTIASMRQSEAAKRIAQSSAPP